MEMTPALKAKMSGHIENDIESWPADCADIVQACNNMSEFSAQEKDWFSKNLPHGTFKTPGDVKKSLHW